MSARPGLCGGHRATGVPTAIATYALAGSSGRRVALHHLPAILVAALFVRRILAATRKGEPRFHSRKAQPSFSSSYPDRTSATFAAHHLERRSVRPGGRLLSRRYR